MAAYDPAGWTDLYVAAAGAAAALTGLLFVAVSINLERILQYPWLPGRAAGTLGLLLAVLVVALLVLTPGQGVAALGAEAGAVGLVVAATGLRQALTRIHDRPDDPVTWALGALLVLLLPGGALVAGGVSLIAGGGGGLYWLLAATILGLVGAVGNAWVLLVEIQR